MCRIENQASFRKGLRYEACAYMQSHIRVEEICILLGSRYPALGIKPPHVCLAVWEFKPNQRHPRQVSGTAWIGTA